MKMRRMKARRTALAAAGIAMAASVGLVGAGAASGAGPNVKIKQGAIWTEKEVHGGCEQLVFASNGTFAAVNPTLNGDTGTWSGGKSTITVDWTGGLDAGLVFSGTFVPAKGYYEGTISAGMGTLKCRLVDRAIPLC
jgi:hypothetical protein